MTPFRIWLAAALAAALAAVALHYLPQSRSSLTKASAVERFLDAPGSNDTISHHLYHLTRHPHVAGSYNDFQTTASYVLSAFQQYGLSAHFTDYEVLLSYPLSRSLTLFFPNGTSIYTAQLEEADDLTQEDPNVIPTFHAYSPSGDVISEAVYVNYGRAEDYRVLEDLGINLKGAIVIARYGKIFRGDIVNLAAKAGAAAAIIYSDPFDYAEGGKKGFYPDSAFLPPYGVQRGTVFRELGDPLTPGWPSTLHSERLHTSSELPSIPSLPISALDALHILQSSGGPVAPPSWHGALDISDYHVGRGPTLLHFSYSTGSTEWVEENEKLLEARAVAYINVDTAVSGDKFSASATPQLDEFLKSITKKVKDPDRQCSTVFDSWVNKSSSPKVGFSSSLVLIIFMDIVYCTSQTCSLPLPPSRITL
ncbi:hypothetical protein KP509_28G011800 [Ceratopteris richardii]|uniref:PA domain-containing protein n=1 Tax=Ceratopteris richardii TaxID=49495 RepID=A0A8T2RBR0_CERRI|nr:hypothetical protein KP509_28G011800 [Ceratopteris richardii]